MNDSDSVHQEVPVEEWTQVPKGKVIAEGTYVDDEGYLRLRSNDAYAVWHYKGCPVVYVGKENVKMADNGAPWCPQCYATKLDNEKRKQIEEAFGNAGTESQK